MDEFDKQYKALNRAQKEAVDTIEGPVMVVAGPGTGKTTILTLRVANILKQTDTPPDGILAITYTNAGVRAMREKLRKVIGNRAYEVNIYTFHSFASAMISEYPDHFLEIKESKQISDVEQESLIRKIISAPEFKSLRPPGKPDVYISSIVRTIEEAKREALTSNEVRKFAEVEIERIKSDEDSISSRGPSKGKLKASAEEQIGRCQKTILFSKVYEKYEQEKRNLNYLDFSDLIIEILIKLKEDELFLRLIQERFLYILVDEHQDTNDAQNLIISLIAEYFESPNLFIVGDEKQAIYRFQGASVDNFLLLRKRWPNMKLISLDENYRSHQNILDSGFKLIEQNYDGDEHKELRIKLKSSLDKPEKKIEVVIGKNTLAAEDYLVNEVKGLMENKPESTVCIITRKNRELERVIRLLESRGVPVSSERSVDIFHHPIGATFFNLCEYVLDFSKVDALAKTLAVGMWGLDFDRSAQLIRDLKTGQAGNLTNHIPAITSIQDDFLSDGAMSFVIKLAEKSGFVNLVTKDPSYIHVWRGIVTLAESLIREREIINPHELLENLLTYKQSAESRIVKVSVGAPDYPVKAMTAHGSKGLEFDYVFLPYATDESWVSRSRGTSFILPIKGANEGDIRDTRRLFYVALTRAKKHVSIITSLEESNSQPLTPLRFISEIGQENISEVILPRKEVDTTLGIEGTVLTDKDTKIIALTKDVLQESGLSVTALNHFLECPNKFIFESILKMPQAPSMTAVKGTAMHEAFNRVWLESKKTVGQIDQTIRDVSNEVVNSSLLSSKEKQQVIDELNEEVSYITKALLGHFQSDSQVHTEKWVETNFSVNYSGNEINIPLHGKLDAITDSGEVVSIFDYKTRKAMSLGEIRGETKGSNGNYFRQLVYYRYLVENDRRFKNKIITTSLVFVSPDKKGGCPIITLPVSDSDVAKVKNEIALLVEAVWSGRITKLKCEGKNCEYCSQRELLV